MNKIACCFYMFMMVFVVPDGIMLMKSNPNIWAQILGLVCALTFFEWLFFLDYELAKEDSGVRK